MASGHPSENDLPEEFSSSNHPAPQVEPLRINKRSNGHSPVPRRDSLPLSSSAPHGGDNPPFPVRRAATGFPGAPPDSTQYPTAAENMSQHPQQNQYGHQDGGTPQARGTPSPAPSGASRHVSVIGPPESYPTPPAFRHREDGRPARLMSSSQSQTPPPAQDGSGVNPYPQYHQQYWPTQAPSRMTSTSTTAARRGSPPPPETPATEVGDAAPPHNGPNGSQQVTTTIFGGGSQGRTTPRANPTPQPTQKQTPPQAKASTPPRRPWTPTESPGSHPYGPPTVWQGTGAHGEEEAQHAPNSAGHSDTRRPSVNAPEPLEQDFQRLNMSASPPPSYASLSTPPTARSASNPPASNPPATTAQGYPDEKRTVVVGAQTDVPVNHSTHPAFHNDRAQNSQPGSQTHSPAVAQGPMIGQAGPSAQQQQFSPPPQGAGPSSSPPPLPEGWIAHLDPNSGQYYYIHVASSHTQWEFPSVDTMGSPPPPQLPQSPPPNTLAPQASTHQQPITAPGVPSPGFPSTSTFPATSTYGPPTDVTYAQSTTTTFAGPPTVPATTPYSSTGGFQPPPPVPIPGSGINTFTVAPANGEYFGPYLRYINMDVERSIWMGSILIVTEYQQPPTIHVHKSRDLSPNPRQLKAISISAHRSWAFFRYDVDIMMDDFGDMWTYAISTPLGCTRFEFLVAGKLERNWRFIAHSCNDFSLGVKAEERARLGGHGFMWKDLMQKHLDCGGFHAQIGTGDQIYADRMWKEVQPLKEWLEIKGKENRKNAQWTARHEDEIMHAYFHYYTSSWDLPHIREAFAQIPYVFQLDDHDIFDGFGSYPEYMQFSNIFKNIGRIGMHWYLLFQHHTTIDMIHARPDDMDLFTITGTGWHFIKYMGPAIAVVGIDTRSERNPHQVLAGPTYQGLFPKIATLPQSIQHVILILAVPILYPRMETAEQVLNTVATGKKAVTGTFNLFGKVVGSAAGVIGAKEVVNTGFETVKKSVGKHGLMSGMVSVFGEVDLLDDIRDPWTHESKDLERTYLVRTLQGIAHNRGLRISFLSGDVHVCGAGLFHDPNKPSDHKTMYQIISSGIVNAPPPPMVLKLLHSTHANRGLYVPQNGLRSTNQPSDTKEDMLELFQSEVDGRPREHKKLMGKRNYAIFTAFENDNQNKNVSIAVDFIVQGDSVYGPTGKYGPVVIPRLEAGY